VSAKQRMRGRNGDEQIKGFVPIRTQGLFDRRRRCDVHVVHTEVGDWIGQAEDVAFDESVGGNDCTVTSVSISQPLSVVLDGRERLVVS
jgi:hypothetical protein